MDYETVAASAEPGEDYEAESGTLTFESGQRTRSIRIEFLDDTRLEEREAFEVRLSNPQGAIVQAEDPTRVFIVDNDSMPGTETSALPQAASQTERRFGTQADGPDAASEAGTTGRLSASAPSRSGGSTVADRAPTVEGVGVADEPGAVAGDRGYPASADGWAAGLLAAVILGGLVLGGLAGRRRLSRSRS